MDEESPALAQIVAKIAESFSMDARTAAASAVQYDDGDGDRMTLSSGANSAADVNIMLKELVSTDGHAVSKNQQLPTKFCRQLLKFP